MKQLKIYLVLLFVSHFTAAFAQNTSIDSLKNLLPQKKGRERIDVLNRLSTSYREISMPLEAKRYAKLSEKEATALNYKDGLAYAHINLGGVEESTSKFANALTHYKKALELKTQLNDVAEMIGMMQQIATVYSMTNDNQKGLTYAFDAMKLAEKNKMQDKMGNTYNTIGSLYSNLENDSAALRYYYKALHYDSITKDPHGLLVRYNNIGTLFEESNKFDSAFIFYNYALKISEKIGYQLAVSIVKSNIGNIHKYRKNYAEAIRVEEEAIQVGEEIQCESCIATGQLNMGAIYLDMGDYKKAISWFEKSTAIHQKIGAKAELYTGYRNISDAYESLKDYKNSLLFFRKYVEIKDSVLNAENQHALNELQTIHQVEQQDQRIKDMTRTKELDDVKLARNNAYLWMVSIGLILFVLIAFIALRGYRRKKADNLIITRQKNEAELQKTQIETQKKEITDSIHYAQRIQQAILPDRKVFSEIFPDNLLLFKPKSIVSGDFFWITRHGDEVFYATADCTGHGVPGGFMSMLGISLLNEIVNEKKISEPAAILNEMREKVIGSLKQTGSEGENQDGMDMVLCRLNIKTKKLVYAAANNPIWTISNGELKEYKADKQPVGIYRFAKEPFTQHEIQLSAGDMVYTFSDGFADQFGGPKGKKFRYKQLEDLLLSITQYDLSRQQSEIERALENWQGDYEQIDDILVIGIKV